MAEELKSFEFRKHIPRNNWKNYPWEKWTNGSIWRVNKIDDIEGRHSLDDFCRIVKHYARFNDLDKNGLIRRVRVEIERDTDTVVFQFYSGRQEDK